MANLPRILHSALILGLPALSLAQSAIPYAGFGNNGLAIVENYGTSQDVVILDMAEQADGKLLMFGNRATSIGGELFVQRFNANGTLDVDFGDNSRYLCPPSFAYYSARNVVARPNGNFLLIGSNNTLGMERLCVLQLTDAAQPDPNFGEGGLVECFASDHIVVYASLLSPDGSLYITATIGDWATIIKLLPDGTLDLEFGEAGLAILGQDAFPAVPTALALASEGYLVCAAHRFETPPSAWFLAAVDLAGQPVEWFGNNGTRIVDRTPNSGQVEFCNRLALRSDGSIITSGLYQHDGTANTMYCAFSPNGDFDDSFGSNGLVEVPLEPLMDRDNGVVSLLPDGDILFSGAQFSSSGLLCKTRMVRLNADGSFENGFGTNGVFLHHRTGAMFFDAELGGMLANGKLAIAGPISTLDATKNAIMIFDLADISTNVIDPESNAPSPTIFPNPTTGAVTLRGRGLDTTTLITLTDMQGRMVQQWSVNAVADPDLRIELDPSLANGRYLLSLRNDSSPGNVAIDLVR